MDGREWRRDSGHAEGGAVHAHGGSQTFTGGSDEHEVHTPSLAAPEGRKKFVDLMREHGDDYQIEGLLFVEMVDNGDSARSPVVRRTPRSRRSWATRLEPGRATTVTWWPALDSW
jgi:hypothetical protein